MNIPKFLTGLGVTILGGIISTVPILQAASPIMIKTGAAIMIYGATAKVVRAVKKKDVFEHEKILINKMKGNKK